MSDWVGLIKVRIIRKIGISEFAANRKVRLGALVEIGKSDLAGNRKVRLDEKVKLSRIRKVRLG
jgi:hypothetical protein